MLESEREVDPDALTIVVAEAGETVVCAAWIRFERDTEFATLWGGATLPEWRRRGIYRATVSHRANLAAGRGLRYLETDASEDSRPILERRLPGDDHHTVRLVAPDVRQRAVAWAGVAVGSAKTCSNRGSSRTAAKSSSLRASSEKREQLDGPSQVGERVVAGVARERCEARVVVMQPGWSGMCSRPPRTRRARRRIAVRRRPSWSLCETATPHPSRPPGTPRRVWRRQRGRFRPRSPSAATRPDEHDCSWRRVGGLTVDLEGRLPVEHDVQLLLARPGLVVLVDQGAVFAGRVGVDAECVDPEVLAHRNVCRAARCRRGARPASSACRSSDHLRIARVGCESSIVTAVKHVARTTGCSRKDSTRRRSAPLAR